MKTPSTPTFDRNCLPPLTHRNQEFENVWKKTRINLLSEKTGLQSTPVSIIHIMLFAVEYIESATKRSDISVSRLRLFFLRTGGVHLLLLLLNAYYNKTPVGRMPGWTFGILHTRIKISKRALRILIGDAMNDGLIIQMPGRRDKRCKVYAVTEDVVEAWETFSSALDKTVTNSLNNLGNNGLADIDYRF